MRRQAGNPAALSASCLTYLFADRFVRPLRWLDRSTGWCSLTTPTTGTMVSTGAVELRCVATALWSLQRSGQLRIIDKAPMTGKASYRQRRKQNDLLLPEIPCKLKFERIGDPTDQVGLEYLLL